jgi:energy-converting hydrogenase Eha subunit E
MQPNPMTSRSAARHRSPGDRVAPRELVPLAQGVFYVVSGLWPIVHLPSFEAVTGPKRDRWLVRTMGGLIAVVGATLIASAFERPRASARVLGVASALALGGGAAYYAARGRISKIYLADAAVESLIAATWLGAWRT